MYLGFSLGAALGSVTMIYGSVISLGWVAALCEVAALAIVLVTMRPAGSARTIPASVTRELSPVASAQGPQNAQAAACPSAH
jgi:hypothetical protein